jgi:hypothetical protein
MPLVAAPVSPPAGNFIVNVSTIPTKPAFNISSGTFNDGLKLPFLTAGQCQTTDATGKVITTPCGGGSSSVAVTTGNVSGYTSVTSSPTAVINFDSTTFNTALKGGATVFVSLSQSYLTTSSATATYLTDSSATATYLQLSSATAYYMTQSSATTYFLQISTTLSVGHGGTGTSSPGLVVGTNIGSITGTWPNQTINALSTLVNSTASVTTGHFAQFSAANGIIDAGAGSAGFIQNSPSPSQSATIDITGNINTNSIYTIGGIQFISAGSSIGNNDVSVGPNAGNLTMTGHNNVCAGNGTCATVTTGQSNTAIGTSAGGSITTAIANTFIGFNAGNKVTTNGFSTFIGDEAGSLVTSGDKNVLIGEDAGSRLTTGGNNTLVGFLDGALITGSNNTTLGAVVLNNLTTGFGNTCLGDNSCVNLVTSSSNTVVGATAFQSSLGYGGDLNTFIGFNSGNSNSFITREAIAIGANAVAFSSNIAQIGGPGADAVELKVQSAVFDTYVNASSMTVSTMAVSGLAPNQCVQTGAGGLLVVSGNGVCGSGGGGGGTPLEIMVNGLRISSPTPSENFKGPFLGSIPAGATTQISLDPSSVTLQGNAFASAVSTGVLLASDWTTFNNKGSGGGTPSGPNYAVQFTTDSVHFDGTGSFLANTSSATLLYPLYSQVQSNSIPNLTLISSGSAGAIFAGCKGQVGAQFPGSGCFVIDMSSAITPSDGLLIFSNGADAQVGQSLLRLWAASTTWNDPIETITKAGANSGPAIRINANTQAKIEFYDTSLHVEGSNGRGAYMTQSGGGNFTIGYRNRQDTSFSHLVDFTAPYDPSSWFGGQEMVMQATGTVVWVDNNSHAFGITPSPNMSGNQLWHWFKGDITNGGIAASDGSGNLSIVNTLTTSSLTVTAPGGIATTSMTTTGPGDGLVTFTIGNSTYTAVYGTAPFTVGAAAVYLTTSGALGSAPLGGGGGTPGTPVNSVQYNSASAFAGSTNFQFNGTSVTAPVTIFTGTVTINVGGGSQNTHQGLLDIYQNTTTNGYLLSVGSNGQQDQFAIIDQQPVYMARYGATLGGATIGTSGAGSQSWISGNSSLSKINIWNSGEMDLQTSNSGGGGLDIVFLPQTVETLRLSNVTGMTVSSSSTFIGALSMNSHNINNVKDPSVAQDAATKNYVDNSANANDWKPATKLATTSALPTNTYSNGASGVGATLTGIAFGALSIDGVVTTVGDRVLVKNETAKANNGIYSVTTVGAVATLYVLTRGSDYNQTSEIQAGDAVFVTSGTTNISTGWLQVTTGTIIVGTTPIVFNQFTGGSYTQIMGGTGLFGGGTSGSIIINAVSTTAYITQAETISQPWTYSSSTTLSGGLSVSLQTVTGNYTLVSTDTIVLANCSSNCTQTLPTAVGAKGTLYTIKMINAPTSQVTVATTGGQTIDGQTTQILSTQYLSVDLTSDGSNWFIK